VRYLFRKKKSRDGVVWIGVCLLAACLADRRRTCLDMHRRLVLVAKLAGPRFRTYNLQSINCLSLAPCELNLVGKHSLV
jgi:hypothetical protein